MATQPSRATAYGWFVVAVLTLVDVVASIDRYMMGVILVPLKTDLSLTDTQLALVYGVGFALLYCLAGVPIGWFAGRVHRKGCLIAACVMWTAATLLCAFAATFEQLFLMRFGVGLGEAALVPLAISLIGAYIPRQQLGTANGLFFAGATIGKALSFIGGGFALTVIAAAGGLAIAGHVFKPWQALFLLAALPGIVATVLLLTIREPARRGPAAPSEPEAKADTGAFLAHFRAHLRTYVLLIGGSCGLHMSAASVAAWVVSLYVREHGMSLESAATAAGLIGLVGGVVGALVGGVVVDALIRRGVRGAPVLFIAGTLLIGAPMAYVAFTGTESLAISLAAYVVFHTANLAGGPQTFAAVQHVTPLPFRGFMSAILLATITLLSLTVGPLLIGILSDVGGSQGGLGRAMAISVVFQNVVGAALLLTARNSFDRTSRSMN